ncbi:MAG: radical SAM protein [Spirochaetaceae bacterium]|nr:MAG: radical SAM protein [Spirochaetaceae bacterium]
MPYSNYYSELIHRVYVEENLVDSPYMKSAVEQLPGIPIQTVRSKQDIPQRDLNRHTLFAGSPRGKTVTRCPGSRGHLCCNYLTVDLYLGCTMGCGYCIMESYLNFTPLTVYLEPERSIARLQDLARQNADLTIRAGTGEVGDSLLLDPLFGLSERFITDLSTLPNLFFELKTKTHFVDHILDIEQKGNAVIGFSVNPQRYIEAYEPQASSLVDRLDAARRVLGAGYRLAFHFDPVFFSEDWREEYLQLISALSEFPSDRIAWISLGTMRYTPALKEKLGEQPFLYEEFVPCRDGKYRYPQKIRGTIYGSLYAALGEVFSAPIYLCMESPTIWHKVFGEAPGKIDRLRAIFTEVKSV